MVADGLAIRLVQRVLRLRSVSLDVHGSIFALDLRVRAAALRLFSSRRHLQAALLITHRSRLANGGVVRALLLGRRYIVYVTSGVLLSFRDPVSYLLIVGLGRFVWLLVAVEVVGLDDRQLLNTALRYLTQRHAVVAAFGRENLTSLATFLRFDAFDALLARSIRLLVTRAVVSDAHLLVKCRFLLVLIA